MLDKFGLVSSAGGSSDSKNLGPGLAAERRVRILVKMEQGGLDFPKDGGPAVVAEGRKLPRVIVQFFHLAECALSVERSKLEEDFKVTRMNSLGSIVVS